ncbi:hypothetical protein SCLCIDRAFT_288908 [Scleroderma citrinum Foug A]|uniref:Uncharacterized protein n=1 Tax=Scleroderma citrinum Foug A TaxID=1036808 RepID=A0A0C3D4Q1_9AGAM|nr:hypothetical protein SCLCIDRAFT_288908 [Scleroderma citrinum Foug A]
MKAWAATAFLMDIFGGWHLSALIGCLDFFDKLPSIVATEFGEQHTIPTALSSATHEEKGKKIHGCVQSIKATLNNEEWYLTFASKLKSKVFGVELLRIIGVIYREAQDIFQNLRDPSPRVRSGMKKNDGKEG